MRRLSSIDDRLFTLGVLLALTLALTLSGLALRLDHLIYDVGQKLSPRTAPDDIVIVAIDEESLSDLGRWPWSRHLHAQLIERLQQAGAKAIAVDILFSEPQLANPADADRQLAQAIGKAGNVVMPVIIEKTRQNGPLIENLPLPELSAQAKALGRVHVEFDTDSIARSISLWEGLGEPTWPHVVQALLDSAGQLPARYARQAPQDMQATGPALVRQDQKYINFSSAQQRFATVSYSQVLQGEFLPNTFKGKLVLVGATAAGMADSVPTPISGLQQAMPGVEFLANAAASMREQTLITPSPLWLSVLLNCVLAVMPLLWMPRLHTRAALFTNLGFFACALLAVLLLPLGAFVWLPAAAGLIGVLSAYPLWAWRKLESTTAFLDGELARLHHELKKWHADDSLPQAIARMSDPFQKRIAQVQAIGQRLSQFEQEQKESLASVSHDIRVPLASAALSIKQQLGPQHPTSMQLSRALSATEEYLQTSRAQLLDLNAFQELDLGAVLQQALDDIYPLLQPKNLRLQSQTLDEPVWVHGHFDSLCRVVTNVLSNAIRYAPEHSTLQVALRIKPGQAQIDITDGGPGIAAEDLERIFERFVRLRRNTPSTEAGAGLGLHFVQTVLRKHGGSVKVQSQPGQTTFSLQLPRTE